MNETSNKSAATEVLGRMVDTMTADNWHRGSLVRNELKYTPRGVGFVETGRCVAGHADLQVCELNPHARLYGKDYSDLLYAVYRLLDAQVPDDFRKAALAEQAKVGAVFGEFVFTVYNDNPSTTFEDIALLVKRAYEASL